MEKSDIKAIQSMFASRLDTLEHLLRRAEEASGESTSFLDQRIAPDMFPLGTQIAFTCNQPRNFSRWCRGQPADNLNPEVASVQQASSYIINTQELLVTIICDDSKLAETTRVDLGPDTYIELSGASYVHDFLIPNFYFHLVTTYNILRMIGLEVGKRDYMLHLVPYVRQG